MHYLDNASTTAVHPAVALRVSQVLERYFANPSSLYRPGYEAEQVIQQARQQVAQALGISLPLDTHRPEILFTASGTESNNLAILGAARARKNWGNHIVATGYEHPSVTKPLTMLEEEGFTLTFVPPGTDGNIATQDFLDAITPKTVLACFMAVNNETGAVLDTNTLAKQVKEINRRTAIHVDAVQAFTKQPIHLGGSSIDSLALSGHKIHAPKGIGALYLRKGYNCQPVLGGGLQEGGIRPGTENTAYIAGLATAVELATNTAAKDKEQIAFLHQTLHKGLESLEGIVINSPSNGWKGIINLSLPAIRSETMLHFLEEKQVYVSSGSACSKGEKSHTLTAMGLPPERVDTALRVSLTGQNTQEDIAALLAGLKEGIASLARIR